MAAPVRKRNSSAVACCVEPMPADPYRSCWPRAAAISSRTLLIFESRPTTSTEGTLAITAPGSKAAAKR